MSRMNAVVLGGYPAKQCPRVVHNEYAPGVVLEGEVSPELQVLFEAGRAYEVEVMAQVRAELGDRCTDLDDEDASWSMTAEHTLAAMRRGDEVIIGGRLPTVGPRSGAPDVLLRVGPVSDPSYLPVDIKNHRVSKKGKNGSLAHSQLGTPLVMAELPGISHRGNHWRSDTMQLAHYTRMLQDLGLHPGQDWLRGGIIGTDLFTSDLSGDGVPVIAWCDLSEAGEKTYSASADSGRRTRSPVERYDHEFTFRVKVAEAARAGDELVRPIGTDECFTCVWSEHCAEVVGPDDASFALASGRLKAREWTYLHGRGIHTVADLANLTLEPELVTDFARHAADRTGAKAAEEALRTAITKADMTIRGVDLEPIAGPDRWPTVPAADVEVDFDIEWDRQQRIYQYGFRVRRGSDEGTAQYQPVVSFEPLDDAGAAALADQAADFVEGLIAESDARGESLRIYHWSPVEIRNTLRYPRLAAALSGRSEDLYVWAKGEFVARRSFSIKQVAPIFGFA
ncbi:recombinase RecB [Dermacoccaceae bacterium W4C1]